MVDKKYVTVGSLLLLLLATGVVYVTLPDANVKLRIDNDKSTFYVIEDSRWVVSGREYNTLLDGTSKLYRRPLSINVDTVYDNLSNQVTITRTTQYIRGPTIIDTYEFDGNTTDEKLFPVSHTVEVYNATGYYYKYEVKDLVYNGATFKLDGVQNKMNFGRHMIVEWWDDYRLGWVYANGNMYVKSEKITDDYIAFDVRLFDPLSFNMTIEDKFEDLDVELKTGLNVSVTTNSQGLVYVDIDHVDYGTNFISGNDSFNFELEIQSFFTKLFGNKSGVFCLSPPCTFTEINYTYAGGDNNTFFVPSHQYDEAVYMKFNLTGYAVGGVFPTNVKLYVNDTLDKDLGDPFNNKITTFGDGSTAFNVSFNELGTQTDGTIRVFGTVTVDNAFLNVTGYKYFYVDLTADNTASSGTFLSGHAASSAYDNDYATYASPANNKTATVYFNYTKPTGALNTSLWQVKDFNGTTNLSIYSTCFSQAPLQYRSEMVSDNGFVTEMLTDVTTGTCDAGNWTAGDPSHCEADCGGANHFILCEYATTSYVTTVSTIDVSAFNDGDITFENICTLPAIDSGDYTWMELSCDGGSWITNLGKLDGSQCTGFYIPQTVNIKDTCGSMPNEIDIRFKFRILDNPSRSFFNREIEIWGETKANISWDCYTGSVWQPLRTMNYSISDAHTFSRSYENSMYWNSYPNDAWMEIGTVDGTREWNMTGEHNSTDRSNDFATELNSYIADCTLDDAGYCSVPITSYSASIGKLGFSGLNVSYSTAINPVIVDIDLVNGVIGNFSTKFTVPITLTSDTAGIIQIDDYLYRYAGGNQTYNVTAHNADYSDTETVNLTYYYSRWDYALPNNIDYIEFIPKSSVDTNVSAYGQRSTIPILNISNYAYGGKTFNYSVYINETIACLNYTMSNTSSKGNGIILTNLTWIELYEDSAYEETFGVWWWEDLNCNYSDWYYYEPDVSFRACCDGCVCDTDLT